MRKKRIYCSVCNNPAKSDPCSYCVSATRNRSQICIVEESYSLSIIEKTHDYKGLYHILHGSLSPTRGIGPDKLMLSNLFPRLTTNGNEGGGIKKVLIAANSTIESQTTANYLMRLLKPLGIPLNKIEIEETNVIETETVQ